MTFSVKKFECQFRGWSSSFRLRNNDISKTTFLIIFERPWGSVTGSISGFLWGWFLFSLGGWLGPSPLPQGRYVGNCTNYSSLIYSIGWICRTMELQTSYTNIHTYSLRTQDPNKNTKTQKVTNSTQHSFVICLRCGVKYTTVFVYSKYYILTPSNYLKLKTETLRKLIRLV